MSDEYDTLVIGGGPAGLTIASLATKRVCLVEAESGLGGAHRVDRVGGLFAEHSPRVVHDSYVNLKAMLRRIGTSFERIFRAVDFSPVVIDSKGWHRWLSLRELAELSAAYLSLGSAQKRVSVAQFAAAKGFSERSKAYLDAVCRYSDGAGSDRYSLFEFLSGFDQHFFGRFYVPRVANDRGLFRIWGDHLKAKGVDLVLGDPVVAATGTTVTLASGRALTGKRLVWCVAPKTLGGFYPALAEYAAATRYEGYPSKCFHFDRPQKLAKGLRTDADGLVALNYGDLAGTEPHHIISCASTRKRPGWRSKRVPTPDMLKTVYGITDDPVAETVSEVVTEAFVAAAGAGPLPPDVLGVPGVYTVGAHNGNSTYAFTSMEAAVQNALAFLGRAVVPTPTTRGAVAKVLLGALALRVILF